MYTLHMLIFPEVLEDPPISFFSDISPKIDENPSSMFINVESTPSPPSMDSAIMFKRLARLSIYYLVRPFVTVMFLR